MTDRSIRTAPTMTTGTTTASTIRTKTARTGIAGGTASSEVEPAPSIRTDRSDLLSRRREREHLDLRENASNSAGGELDGKHAVRRRQSDRGGVVSGDGSRGVAAREEGDHRGDPGPQQPADPARAPG